ncbi:MAG: hypothetical protein NC417_06920 [Candidatus Gastranaerophilales bacterium]|nr:hypothetical protein [Candidatus Gastranaerophilales bacterium]
MKRKITFISCLIVFVLLLAGIWFYRDNLVYKVVRAEAGMFVTASDFLRDPDGTASFTGDSPVFDIKEPDEYSVIVRTGLFTYHCTLIIEDTIPPKAQASSVTIRMGESCEPDVFVSNIEDATQVAVSYVDEPDYDKGGAQNVSVRLTDRGGNETIVEAELLIIPVVEEVTLEAGTGPVGLDSFVISAEEANFITPINLLDDTVPGDYEIYIKVDGLTYTSILHIVDTVPPEAVVHDVEGYAQLPRTAEEFVTEVSDVTEVVVVFREEPDLNLIGTQELELLFTDQGGNEVIKQVNLTLWEDTEAPVIHGAADLQTFVGDTVSYRKQVSVTDNNPDGLELTVDTTGVDLQKEGVYPITYTATDAAGNTTSVTVNLTVSVRTHSQEEVFILADAVLAGIITPEMSEREKAQAIYNYIISHVGYLSHSEKGDWVRAAYEGLAQRQGDCYVYACTAKALLTRAGISNMDIAKIPSRVQHYWNLVDIGEGWYHFDTTPRTDHPVIFMWTDEELMNYSAAHHNSHNYDHTAYPPVN